MIVDWTPLNSPTKNSKETVAIWTRFFSLKEPSILANSKIRQI